LPFIHSNVAEKCRESDHAQMEMKLDIEEQFEG
jgi:hypothetical protein